MEILDDGRPLFVEAPPVNPQQFWTYEVAEHPKFRLYDMESETRLDD
jgi:hypothetical protein